MLYRATKIPQIHYYHDLLAASARSYYHRRRLWEASLLDDLRALIEFAQAGSIAGAADRLFRTPSAISRQVQRLEAALGAELLDRSVKPPRLNPLGSRVLEQARDLLQRTEALKSLASSEAEPQGLLRIGLAHALAEGTFIEPVRALTEEYPKVRLRLLSELTGELFNRLLSGEIDVAAVLLPEGKAAPHPLLTNIIATDRMEIVQGAAGNVDDDWESLGRVPWVLNPPGCLLRASLIDQMDRAGSIPTIAAEIHNMHLQLAFVQSGYGVGLLPARFIARNGPAKTVKVLRPPSFDLNMSVAIVRAGQLGALEKTVRLFEQGIRRLFEKADATKPVMRTSRSR
jgi:DNA-binding transcriptional LysR family regulator